MHSDFCDQTAPSGVASSAKTPWTHETWHPHSTDEASFEGRVEVDRGHGWAVVCLRGDIDLAWAEHYQQHLAAFFEDCPGIVVVDLSDVTFMDSTGLTFLANCVRACQAAKGQVMLVGSNNMVRATIGCVGLERYMTLIETDLNPLAPPQPSHSGK